MKIGSLQLAGKIVLAPMAGITDLPYRLIMKRFGAALVVSEMVSANGLARGGSGSRELLRTREEERPLGVQLFGDDPALLARAAALAGEAADLVDINLGCPVKKVIRSGAGSALLRRPDRVARIVREVRRVTPLPLTVKIRSGWDAGSENFLEIGRIAESEGADAVTLHPRTRSQGFGGRADWSHIRSLKETLCIPVIGSGDICSPADAGRMLAETGCDGVMIGRGALGNPWLLSGIAAHLRGEQAGEPAPGERLDVALDHLRLYLEIFGPRRAPYHMRKHFSWYSRGLHGAAAFRAEINRRESVPELEQCLVEFFGAAERESALAS